MFNVPRKLNQIGTERSFRILGGAVNFGFFVMPFGPLFKVTNCDHWGGAAFRRQHKQPYYPIRITM
jgi:hypothetical protein